MQRELLRGSLKLRACPACPRRGMTDAAGNGHEQRGRRYRMIMQADQVRPRSAVPVTPTALSARPRRSGQKQAY
jgi:hypothetical protein